MPHDLGVGGPRLKRSGEFVGRRSLFTAEGERADRKQLVGLSVAEGEPPLATGAHGVERQGRAGAASVTSRPATTARRWAGRSRWA